MNQTKTLTTGGQSFTLAPLTLGQIGPLCRTIAPIFDELSTATSAAQIMALVGDHGDAFVEALAIASGRPADALASLPLESAIELATTLIQMNAANFEQRFKPAA